MLVPKPSENEEMIKLLEFLIVMLCIYYDCESQSCMCTLKNLGILFVNLQKICYSMKFPHLPAIYAKIPL